MIFERNEKKKRERRGVTVKKMAITSDAFAPGEPFILNLCEALSRTRLTDCCYDMMLSLQVTVFVVDILCGFRRTRTSNSKLLLE